MNATTIIPFGQSCENALKTQNTKLPHNKHYSFHRFLYTKKFFSVVWFNVLLLVEAVTPFQIQKNTLVSVLYYVFVELI